MRKPSICIHAVTSEECKGGPFQETWDLFLQFVYFKSDATRIMALCTFAQHCRASLSETWSVVWTSGSLPGLFSLAPVPALHGVHFGEGMTFHGDVCAFPAADRGSENFGQAKWQLENVPTHSLKQKQTCLLHNYLLFSAPQKHCFACYQL